MNRFESPDRAHKGTGRLGRLFAAAIAIALSWSATAQANCAFSSGTGQSSCEAPISKVYMSGGSVLLFELAADLTPIHCQLVSGVYWSIDKSNPWYGEYEQLLLIAADADQNVSVVSQDNNSTQPCQVSYLVLEN